MMMILQTPGLCSRDITAFNEAQRVCDTASNTRRILTCRWCSECYLVRLPSSGSRRRCSETRWFTEADIKWLTFFEVTHIQMRNIHTMNHEEKNGAERTDEVTQYTWKQRWSDSGETITRDAQTQTQEEKRKWSNSRTPTAKLVQESRDDKGDVLKT